MTDPSLNGMLDTVWTHLSRGSADHRHPARHPTLATIGPDGPELRTLVLRAANRDGAELEFHTDAASPKAVQITAHPAVALHVWVPGARLQIRMAAIARILPGDPALFALLPHTAQANYQGPVPGTPVSEAADTPATGPRFARLICRLTHIDALILDTPHRRARFDAATDWTGTTIAP